VKRLVTILFLLLAIGSTTFADSTDSLLDKIVEQARKNDDLLKSYGSFQETVTKKVEEDGKVKSQQTRTYRTVWIEDSPYEELVQVDGKPPDSKQKKEEAKRRSKFVDSLHHKNKDSGEKEEFTWEDLRAKYYFALLPSDQIAKYVFAFEPKKQKLPERSRAEKVLNHVKGMVWVDDQYNIVRVNANLKDPLRFGLGILARVDEFKMDYHQEKFQTVWVPSSLSFQFEARLALLKNERQNVVIRFYDFYPRSQPQENTKPSSGE
jgi:hypothetical protein